MVEEYASTRRGFLTAAALAGTTLAMPGVIRRAEAADEITVLTWETYQDDPWVAEWSKKSNIKANIIRVGSTDEMFSQVKSGSVNADLLYLDSGSIKRYQEADLIAPVDVAQLPNAKNVTNGLDYKKYNVIDGKLYGMPYNWGTLPLMYNSKVVTGGTDSWMTLLDPKYKEKVILFDDPLATLPFIAKMAGASDPYNLSPSDFDALKQMLIKLRPQVRTIATGYADQETICAAGDAVIGHCQNIAVIFDLQSKNVPFSYSFPKEGTPAYLDNAVFTKRGNRAAVYQFANDNISVDWQVRFIKASLNNGVLTAEAAKAGGVPEDTMKKTNLLDQNDPSFWSKMLLLVTPNDLERRVQLWNDFKAGTL